MKKTVLLMGLSVLLCLTANAQDEIKKTPDNIQFGAKAGVNFSDIVGDRVESFDGKTSFHFGVLAEIPICASFSIQPELVYSRQGSDYSEDFDGEDFSGTVKVDYLNIPVMAKYYVVEGLSIEAGPQVGFLLSATDEYDDEEDDIKDFLKSTDFGVNFGLGYRLDNGLNFSARYNLGLSDNLDADGFETEGAKYKNSVIQVSVGYFFQ